MSIKLKDSAGKINSHWQGTEGSGHVHIIGSKAFAVRTEQATSTVLYVGRATAGTASASALWQVMKIDTTSGVVVTWADGNGDFDNIWDNRASLSYS